MYPPQTSFIPVQIALARFLENYGWKAFFVDYPFWYLGTTPFRYLTGPILPTILVIFHKILPHYSLFEIMYGFILAGWIVGAVGIYWLAFIFSKKTFSSLEKIHWFILRSILIVIFYLLSPIVPFLFRFSDGLSLISFSIIPYILVFYLKFLNQKERRMAIYLIFLIGGLLLLDSGIILPLIVALIAVLLAETGWKKIEEKLKKTSLIFLLAFGLATLWYSPGYWLTLVKAPSLAGKPFLSVAIFLPRLLSIALAVFLAILSSHFFRKRNFLRDFCFFWLFIFGFLTLARFIADPDFWLDWSIYGIELQFGLAIAGGMMVVNFLKKIQYPLLDIKKGIYILRAKYFFLLVIFLTLYLSLFIFILNKYVLAVFQKDIGESVEYKIGKKLAEIVKPEERVFLSGTTAFWLNAFFDISQVRGGVDRASTHPDWRKAAWEIREGEKAELTEEWLKKLGIKYLVVHNQESREFYHDFRYPSKFDQGNFEKIYDQDGDKIYRLKD